jgi:xanthine dehydrogenase small subunit
MTEDFEPISDMRASAQYRMQIAQNLLQRFYLEQMDTPYPVRLGVRFESSILKSDVNNV